MDEFTMLISLTAIRYNFPPYFLLRTYATKLPTVSHDFTFDLWFLLVYRCEHNGTVNFIDVRYALLRSVNRILISL